MHQLFQYSEEVQQAQKKGQAIVALESTVITHGLPYPANLELAQKMEQTVREQGAVPATLAIGEGRIKIGLNADELELLSQHQQKKIPCVKSSIREIPLLLADATQWGGTTVAATMFLATKAQIEVFATGGIGGVHRGVEGSWDISADLNALGDYPVTVVCAGVKSILDIGKTLEVLETLSVPVVSYQTEHFPAFFSQVSGFKSPYQVKSVQEIALIMQKKKQLGLKGGVLVTQPVPYEDEITFSWIESIIEKGLAELHRQGVRGKEVTPFLLRYLQQHSDGKALQANISLLLHNAKRAAEIAVHYSKITRNEEK